ncbi:MAG: hypothetical protein NZM43_13365 [Saprospiraceae bacterium]|nr:hypothetical protein [Saprospiraceae bacterium]MDW8485304.1 hypothetical protein [Saprospiraceae bacterium]
MNILVAWSLLFVKGVVLNEVLLPRVQNEAQALDTVRQQALLTNAETLCAFLAPAARFKTAQVFIVGALKKGQQAVKIGLRQASHR